jgi:predicted KAP-like P-loop ATPase
MLFSDSPIRDFDEDYLQQEKFVDHLKDILINYNSQESLVIQLRGEWGSGKSSILNMLKNSIENDDKEGLPLVMYFNPWNFSTKNELIKSFFEELSILFKENIGNEEFSRLNQYFNLLMSSVISITPLLGADSFYSIILNFILNISNWISKWTFTSLTLNSH